MSLGGQAGDWRRHSHIAEPTQNSYWGGLKVGIKVVEKGMGCALIKMISFLARKKKKCRYLCEATVHLRTAESQSEKKSCELLVLVIQSIFYGQL